MNSPKLKGIIASLVALAGSLTGEGVALGETGVAADEIRGAVKSAHGAEGGVWVIAETQDFQTRFAKIVVTDEAGRYLITPGSINTTRWGWARTCPSRRAICLMGCTRWLTISS